MDNLTLAIDAFVRSVGVNQDSSFSLFIGAGASITSGVPSASRCIWEWKKDIFCTNNPGLEEQVSEISLSAVKNQIDRWLINNGITPDEGEDDYCYYIEQCLPIPDDRRRFFQSLIREAQPHVGYKLICLLAQAQIIKSVWTTNFDGLVARAAAEFSLTPIEIGIDCQERTFRQPARGEIVCVALHGDYRYDYLKNTRQELLEQEEALKQHLIRTMQTDSLIVSGYSGRDDSVMKALYQAITDGNGRGKIFWCGYSHNVPDPVAKLLRSARNCGRDAYYIPGAAFDDLMERTALRCLRGELLSRAKQLMGESSSSKLPVRVAFNVKDTCPTTLLKSNAWEIKFPSEMFQFGLQNLPNKVTWKWVENKTENTNVIAVPLKGKILALGTMDGIKDAFKDEIDGAINRVPITEKDIRYEDGAVINLLRRAFVQSVSAMRNFGTDKNSVIWTTNKLGTKKIGSSYIDFFDAAKIYLRRIARKLYLVIEPTIHFPNVSREDMAIVRCVKMRELSNQYNKQYDEALRKWRGLIFDRKEPTLFDFPYNTRAFIFEARTTPIYAAIAQKNKSLLTVKDNIAKHVFHRGIEVSEPKLRFAKTSDDRYKTDTLPLRGLSSNAPFDRSLVLNRDEKGINVAVICPLAETDVLENFLKEAHLQHLSPRGKKEDYLVSYQGFQEIFHTPIFLPTPGHELWHTLPELDKNMNSEKGSLELSRKIRSAIDSLTSIHHASILIYIPDRWKMWWGFENDREKFDLHDFIKAYCVQRGIATQFINDNTINYDNKCRIWWWLSIAFYTKAMRTPWVLEGLDPDSAYVGIGYGIDRKAEKNKKIVLGCSHIFNAQGQGLQFRLSHVENPIMFGRNPFLSYEDARRMGETIRELFYKAHYKLPKRVVIHKLTPFRIDEQKGLLAGLDGIQNVDLIEINQEPSLRYLSSKRKNGKLEIGMFPVQRGTVIRLSDYEALLWIHGSAEAINPSWSYYQGKRRIPSPVVIRRYSGRSDLATICSEILGFSKMDWNSGDLYGQLPVTVQSSKRIARIGLLLNRFQTSSYDYRLFM